MSKTFTPNRVIVLNEIPPYDPSDLYLIDYPDNVAHVQCDGANFHIVHYANGVAVCSHPRCIINRIAKGNFNAKETNCA